MKGLLIKDFKLLKQQKRFIAISLFVVIAMALYGTQNIGFLVIYATLIGCMLPMSTVTYDEMDNGNVFLFSLPVSRQGYVIEKYVYCLICGGCAWLMATVAASASGIVKNTGAAGDVFMTALPFLPVVLVFLAIMLPFQLLFGSDKGRIAYMIIVGGTVVAAFFVEKIVDFLHIDMNSWAEKAASMNMAALGAGAGILAAVLYLISCCITIRAMKKKEF